MPHKQSTGETAEWVNPIASKNNHPIIEVTIQRSPEVLTVKERVARVLDVMPEEMKPPCLRGLKGVSVVNNERILAFLPKSAYAKYTTRIGGELGTGMIPFNVFYQDVRTSQAAIPIHKDPDQLFDAVGLAIAELNAWVIRRPSLRALTEALGYPSDRTDLVDATLEHLNINRESIIAVRNGSILFRDQNGNYKMQVQPGVHIPKEVYNVAFTSYMNFIDYCLMNGAGYPPENIAKLVQDFRNSDQFKKLAIPEDLYLYDVWDRVFEGESIEGVINEIKSIYQAKTSAERAGALTAFTAKQRFYEELVQDFWAGDIIVTTIKYLQANHERTVLDSILKAVEAGEYALVIGILLRAVDYSRTMSQTQIMGIERAIVNDIEILPDGITEKSALLSLSALGTQIFEEEDPVKLARLLLENVLRKLIEV